MQIEVVKIEYDAEQCQLRVQGKNIRENDHIRLGQFHTIEIEKGRPFTITKSEWNTTRLDILRELANPMQNAEIAVVVMQEGLANICLVRATMTKTCAVVTRTIPKKKTSGNTNTGANQNYEEAMKKFFQDIYAAMILHLHFDTLKVILIGSPGFLNEQFLTYFQERSVREDEHWLQRNEQKQKIIKVHCSTGYKSAVEEILSDPSIAERLQNVRAVQDIQCLKQFETILTTDVDRACYGWQVVHYAAFHDAIDTLLITDALCCSSNFEQRRACDALIQHVVQQGGKMIRFSSMHASGERLASLTGIAAILRYPFPDIDLLAETAALSTADAAATGHK
jgi:protein pelota